MPFDTNPLAATHPGSDEAVAIAASLAAAKDGIEAGVSSNSSTAITVNAASFGDRQFLKILCTGATAITVTLANNVPAGKAVELVAYHATADVTVQPGSGATLVPPQSSPWSTTLYSTTAQYEALVLEVDTNAGTNAAWRLVTRP